MRFVSHTVCCIFCIVLGRPRKGILQSALPWVFNILSDVLLLICEEYRNLLCSGQCLSLHGLVMPHSANLGT